MVVEKPVLRPTLAIRSNEMTDCGGLLGPMLVGARTGTLYGLTAAQMLQPRATLLSVDQGIRISDGDANSVLVADAIQECSNLIAAVPLVRDLKIGVDIYSAGSGKARDVEPKILESADGLIGKVLQIHTASGVRSAMLRSATARFLMPSPLNGKRTMFVNALRLLAMKDEAVFLPEERGAILSTEEGNWLGVVVVGKAEVAYAGLLYPVQMRLRLSVIRTQDIAAHNTELDEKSLQIRSSRTPAVKFSHGQKDVQKASQEADLVLSDAD